MKIPQSVFLGRRACLIADVLLMVPAQFFDICGLGLKERQWQIRLEKRAQSERCMGEVPAHLGETNLKPR